MWKQGNVNGFEFNAKVYRTPSDMGIDQGRISKLTLKQGGKIVVSYDRGWDIRPATTEQKQAVAELVKKYSRPAPAGLVGFLSRLGVRA